MTRFALAIAGGLLLSGSAHAYTITVSDTLLPNNGIFDNCVGQDTCKTPIGFFDLLGEAPIVAGGETIPNVHVAPSPTGAYIPGANVVFHATTEMTSIEFNWGSVDGEAFDGGENIFVAGNNPILDGSTILGLADPANLSRNYSVIITGLLPFHVATWTNYPATVFEFNSVGVVGDPTGAPETSTWAMMLLGFAGLGFAGYRKAHTPRLASI